MALWYGSYRQDHERSNRPFCTRYALGSRSPAMLSACTELTELAGYDSSMISDIYRVETKSKAAAFLARTCLLCACNR